LNSKVCPNTHGNRTHSDLKYLIPDFSRPTGAQACWCCSYAPKYLSLEQDSRRACESCSGAVSSMAGDQLSPPPARQRRGCACTASRCETISRVAALGSGGVGRDSPLIAHGCGDSGSGSGSGSARPLRGEASEGSPSNSTSCSSGSCNHRCRRLQPWVLMTAAVGARGCNHMLERLVRLLVASGARAAATEVRAPRARGGERAAQVARGQGEHTVLAHAVGMRFMCSACNAHLMRLQPPAHICIWLQPPREPWSRLRAAPTDRPRRRTYRVRT